MATNVTVLGAAGATVTIPFTSAANAAAAQNALSTISDLVSKSVLTQVNYSSGPVAAPTLMGGVVVSGNAPVNLGMLPGGVYSVVNTATNGSAGAPGTTVVGATNPMTVASGTGGIVFLNVSSNAQVFLDGGTNLVGQGASSASAVIGVSTDDTHVDARLGSTTINAYDDSQIQVWAGSGTAVVNAMGDNVVNVFGDNTGNAVSVFATGSSLGFIGSPESTSYIDPGTGNVTVAADSGQLTLVGGSGDALVFGAHGLIDGGTGTNYLITDSLAGATTLMSAGANDTLIGQGAGNMYITGGSNALVADQSDSTSGGGAIYQATSGTATIFGSIAANSLFNIGDATVTAYGQHGADGTRGNIYMDAYDGANQITIGDFVVNQDYFSLSRSSSGAALSSLNYYDDAGTSAFGAVGTQAILTDGTKIDFLNVNVGNSSFT
jgi:hypothetical protein